MKKTFEILLTFLILGTIAYQLYSLLHKEVPCEDPIPYVLGTFDDKFKISQDYFLNALLDAEAIWEEPSGLDLFTFTPEDSSSDILKINLIYDYRQQATNKLASLGIVVDNTKASYEKLKSKFTVLKAEYDRERIIFSARAEDFNSEKLAYEKEVDYWNKKGGAPQEEYEKLEATRLALQNESKQLQNMQTDLKEKADEINALVVILNRLITSLNLTVEKYNTTNVARGESFEEGVYTRDGLSEEIDIYEFSNRTKLVRVLAHELGHALGLGHVDDPNAIMYELNKDNNETLTKADLEALEIRCGIK